MRNRLPELLAHGKHTRRAEQQLRRSQTGLAKTQHAAQVNVHIDFYIESESTNF